MQSLNTLTPLGNRMIVREFESRRQGVIVIPATAKPEFGTKVFYVLKVGEKVKEVKPHDRVIAYGYTSGPVELADGCWMITESEVLAVIEPEPCG